jgi:4-amino-4-deoxy-L-arabinose transferase-like glycosyltransferase
MSPITIDRKRLKAGLLLIGTVGLALLGQHYFFHRRAYVWDALIFFALSLCCFAAAMRTVRQTPVPPHPIKIAPSWREWIRQGLAQRRTIVSGLALILNYTAARSANTQPPPQDFTFSIALWLISLVVFFIACVPFPRLTPHSSRFTFCVFFLLFTGFILRALDLEHIPANLGGDEGTQALWARDVLEGQLRNPFSTGWFTVPTMSFFAQAASLRLFGDTVAGLRMLSALVGAATLFFTYLLARQLFKPRVALFALAALAFNHYHIHFSRLGSNQIADPFFMALTLWLLTKGIHKESSDAQYPIPNIQHPTPNTSLWFMMAGLSIGLSWYGYFGSRVILITVAAFFGLQTLAERGFLRRHARSLTLMALAAFMVVSPLLLYYANYPDNLSARWNQVSFFHWLKNELARPNHDSTFELVVRQIWRSISAFNHTLDPTFWYRARIPLLDFVSGMLFILGLAVAIARRRRSSERLILLWFGLSLTFGWILTENPPSSMRMVIIAPAVAVLAALGLDRLLTLARWVIGGRATHWRVVAGAILTVIAILNIHYYFFIYTPTRVYGNPSAETATVLARYLKDRQDRPLVYFYGPPFLYFDFGSIQFIARDAPGVSVPPKSEAPAFPTPVNGPTLFVVLRERLEELNEIQARYPRGALTRFRSDANGRLMFVVYEVAP